MTRARTACHEISVLNMHLPRIGGGRYEVYNYGARNCVQTARAQINQ